MCSRFFDKIRRYAGLLWGSGLISLSYAGAGEPGGLEFNDTPNALVDVYLPSQSASLIFGVDGAKESFYFIRDKAGHVIKVNARMKYYELQEDYTWKSRDNLGIGYELTISREKNMEIRADSQERPGKPSHVAVDVSVFEEEFSERKYLPLKAFDFDARLYFSKSAENNFVILVSEEGKIEQNHVYLFSDEKLVLRVSIIKSSEKLEPFFSEKMRAALSAMEKAKASKKGNGLGSDYAQALMGFYGALPTFVGEHLSPQKELDDKIQGLVESYKGSSAYFKWKYDLDESGKKDADKEEIEAAINRLNDDSSRVRGEALMKIMQYHHILDYKKELSAKLPGMLASNERFDRVTALFTMERMQWNGFDSVKEFAPALRKYAETDGISPMELRNIFNLLEYSQGRTPKVESFDALSWWRSNLEMVRAQILKSLPEKAVEQHSMQ